MENRLLSETIKSKFIPDDNNEGTIISIYDVTRSIKQLDYYEGNIFSIEIQFDFDSEVDFYIFKADYYAMYGGDNNREFTPYVSHWNDHYYEATKTYDTSLIAKISFSLPLNDANQLPASVKDWSLTMMVSSRK